MSELQTINHAPQKCPHCGAAFECATQLHRKATLQSGALSLCVECAGLMQVDEQMKFVRLPAHKEVELLQNPIIRNARLALLEYNAKRRFAPQGGHTIT